MKMNRTLPTDKNGNIYYGPKTVAQAAAAISDMDAPPEKVVADLRAAGYSRVAAIVATKFVAGVAK